MFRRRRETKAFHAEIAAAVAATIGGRARSPKTVGRGRARRDGLAANIAAWSRRLPCPPTEPCSRQ